MAEVKLIDMNTLWTCETCFHRKSTGCDTWCDAGESYRPAASKLKVIEFESLRPTGRWILKDQNGNGVCSHCNRQDAIDPLATHCRYCGCKMED